MIGLDYWALQPPDPVPGVCACGLSTEDCPGDCWGYSLDQQRDPETGEQVLPKSQD